MLPPDGPDAQAGLEAEVGAFLDMYGGDPDLDELREEFRPRLKERFDGWVKVATAMTKSGTVGVAAGVYERAVERMPFLKGADVVEVMLSRLVLLFFFFSFFFVVWVVDGSLKVEGQA